MAKKPITPGQKAARARDRQRFADKLAANEAEADRVHERLLAGDRLTTRDGTAYAFADDAEVSPAIVAILRHRKLAMPRGDRLVACTPAAYAKSAVAEDKAAAKRKAARLDRWLRSIRAAGDDDDASRRALEAIADEAIGLRSIED